MSSKKEFNLRKHRWAKCLTKYDVTIHYHQGKAKVVAKALSRKSANLLTFMELKEWQLLEQVVELNIKFRLKVCSSLKV